MTGPNRLLPGLVAPVLLAAAGVVIAQEPASAPPEAPAVEDAEAVAADRAEAEARAQDEARREAERRREQEYFDYRQRAAESEKRGSSPAGSAAGSSPDRLERSEPPPDLLESGPAWEP